LHLDGSPHVIRLQRSLYGTSMPGAGAVHHIKTGPKADVRVESDLPPITDVGHAPRQVAEVPKPDIALPGWTALKRGDMEITMASGVVLHLGATALTRVSRIAAILAIATHRAVNKLQFQIQSKERSEPRLCAS
jgi:hypothetical protein